MASGTYKQPFYITTIQDTLPENTTTKFISYPDGFTQSTTRIIGFEIYYNSLWRSGQGVGNSEGLTPQTVVLLGSTGIGLNNQNSSLFGASVRITLLHY